MYFASAALILLGVLAMRWNVVIGGQLFSKSLRGFTTYKMELAGTGRLAGRAGIDSAAVSDSRRALEIFPAAETRACHTSGNGTRGLEDAEGIRDLKHLCYHPFNCCCT